MQLVHAYLNDFFLFFTHDFRKVHMGDTAPRPFLLFTAPHQSGGWGCTRIWVGTQLSLADERDHMVSCSVYKAEEKRREHLK